MTNCDDGERPPVLAHQRYEAERHRFAGLDLAARFELIDKLNLWGAAGSVSGLGSEYAATAAVREALPKILDRLRISSLLDAPCGDARWIMAAGLTADYAGVDIVGSLIAANREFERPGPPATRFLVADITRDALPAAELVLCRDCLVHLTFTNIGRVLANFRASGARWLLATTFPAWNENTDCEDGDWRALNMQRAPFRWPEPEILVDERCTEGDGGWSDKSLGLWRIAALPDPDD
ncbi:MAG: class I SAM-dependent methyltransferase [Alphaproteobacteria bacterium]|nr:class I SAM-dependent methyltransferase [Alphaproteobacteria bacterium]